MTPRLGPRTFPPLLRDALCHSGVHEILRSGKCRFVNTRYFGGCHSQIYKQSVYLCLLEPIPGPVTCPTSLHRFLRSHSYGICLCRDHFLISYVMSSLTRRPPIPYRERSNTDPCGGPNNVNNGCQMVFPRMEPGGRLCFLCTKLQDPEISTVDRIDIRVWTPISLFSALLSSS